MIAGAERHAQAETSDADGLLAAAKAAREVRRRRGQVFGDELLAEPCWDLLLDVFIGAQEGKRLSIAAACLAMPVPKGTAKRCIAHLADVGLISSEADAGGQGVSYLVPTEQAVAKLTLLLSCRNRHEDMSAV